MSSHYRRRSASQSFEACMIRISAAASPSQSLVRRPPNSRFNNTPYYFNLTEHNAAPNSERVGGERELAVFVNYVQGKPPKPTQSCCIALHPESDWKRIIPVVCQPPGRGVFTADGVHCTEFLQRNVQSPARIFQWIVGDPLLIGSFGGHSEGGSRIDRNPVDCRVSNLKSGGG